MGDVPMLSTVTVAFQAAHLSRKPRRLHSSSDCPVQAPFVLAMMQLPAVPLYAWHDPAMHPAGRAWPVVQAL